MKNLRTCEIIPLGRPTHYVKPGHRFSACGIEVPYYGTKIANDVNCLRCRKTREWRKDQTIYKGDYKFKNPKPDPSFKPERFSYRIANEDDDA